MDKLERVWSIREMLMETDSVPTWPVDKHFLWTVFVTIVFPIILFVLELTTRL